ncbi:MotE family protein [Tepidicaulis sp.]|uniref:MotE family protein n=1 Tax=Tepidicaulis sp. TaxID=1920809 RepID=UPI003B59A831
MRILPIALTAAFLALPMQMEIVVHESAALAKGVAGDGFGDHPRPWANDLLNNGQKQPAESTQHAEESLKREAVEASAEKAQAGAMSAAADLSPENCAATSADIESRLSRLQAAERRLQKQLAGLTALQGAIETLLVQQTEAEKQDLQQLVNLYRNMKPVEAAGILGDMELPIVVSVVLAMKEREAAPILAQMPKAAAQDVTREIARRRSLERLDISQL